MLLPFCMKCKKFFIVEKIGVMVYYEKHKYWFGDILKCPECGLEIISQFGQEQNYWDDKTKFELSKKGRMSFKVEQ